jgi:dihydrofolate synthase / folylpolyglutamate synthase
MMLSVSSSPYLEALSALCQPIRAGDYPQTLRPMLDLLSALGNPHQGIPAVVVAGSSGKGTTCYQIARLLRANGLNVGLYISPHLHSFRERFIFNDKVISEADFIEGVQAVRKAANGFNHLYSTFEQATALAFWWFARQKPDILVLEIGLGGRFDAVNVVRNTLAVFTRIETEHMAMLGGSLRSVAWHKAGIIQPNGHALTVKQATDVYMVLFHEAKMKQARLHLDGGYSRPEEGPDSFLALAAWQNLLERGVIPYRAFEPGLKLGGLPGRLEQIKIGTRTVLIDGGHTPAAGRYLRHEIDRLAGSSKPVRVIAGMLQDKSAHDYLSAFDTRQFHIILTRAPGHRANQPETLSQQASLRHASVEIVPVLEDALKQSYTAPEELVVVAGSLRMAAAARERYGLLSDSALAEAEATRAIFEGQTYLARLDSSAKAGV